jgi:hypothetical protein
MPDTTDKTRGEGTAVRDEKSQPVINDDGTLRNFMLRVGGKPYRCECGCNVFHKPDQKKVDLYECNACETRFEAA